MKEVLRYSEAFKLQVVREIEEGRHGNCNAAREAYGIGGAVTVQKWLIAYGKEHLLRRVIRVETTDERNELKRLKDRVRDLESALSDAHMDLRIERAYVELACEAGGIKDVEGFKKKHVGQPCIKRSKAGKRIVA
jgi:transposase-like protein